MITLTRTGVVFTGTPRDLDSLRAKFDRDHYVILPRIYEPSLLDEILRRVQAARFFPRDHKGIAVELCMADHSTRSLLNFLHSVPAFLRIIEYITGQPRIGQFAGRVYKMNASEGHYDSWHDDFCGDRVVTMSVNLSPREFKGGALQMKYRQSEEILHEVRNVGLGDAMLFRISENLDHRVQGVTGDNPKIACAGWFLKGEDFLPSLRDKTISPQQVAARIPNDQPDWDLTDSSKHQ